MLTELWIFRRFWSGQCFYRYSIESGRGARVRVHLELESRDQKSLMGMTSHLSFTAKPEDNRKSREV